MGILTLSIVLVEPRQTLEHRLDLTGEVALSEFAPYSCIERSARRTLLFGKQVIIQPQVRGAQRIAGRYEEAVWSRNGELHRLKKYTGSRPPRSGYVLVLLFIKYVSDKYAGVPYAPISIPKGASFKGRV